MSAKDAFFDKVERNANARKESEEAFKRDVLAFQEETKALLMEIKDWFDGSPVTSSVGTTQVTENTTRFEVSNLTLKNGDKTLTIVPEGLYYFGVKGGLEVTINNPNSSPSTSKFKLHWKDSVSQLPGWVIVSGSLGRTPAERTSFNQENFFKTIIAFA